MRYLVCGLLLVSCLLGADLRAQGAQSETLEPDRASTHLEFISKWFPSNAATAQYIEVASVTELATRLQGAPASFATSVSVLDLIRDHVGFGGSEIEQITTATILSGVPGTVVFFTLGEMTDIEEHFASGHAPIESERDHFQQLVVYKFGAGDRPMGLYGSAGKHFILGDWDAFKATLTGHAEDQLNELAKILALHTAPIIICKNPRKRGRRYLKDDPFGMVVAIEFDKDLIAFLVQEEQPTPDMAIERQAVMQEEMPALFETRYEMTTKQGVRYQSYADGRHVIFGGTAKVGDGKLLVESLLGEVIPADPAQLAAAAAEQAVALFSAARAAGAECSGLVSEEAVVAALCEGLIGKAGARFALPFMTRPERRRTAERLVYESGNLALAPVVEEPAAIVPSVDEKRLHRQARLIATLTSSAAAANSPQLKELKTAQEIVAAICTTGLSSGPGHAAEMFKGPELTGAEVEQVAELLVPDHGYLVYRAPGADEGQ